MNNLRLIKHDPRDEKKRLVEMLATQKMRLVFCVPKAFNEHGERGCRIRSRNSGDAILPYKLTVTRNQHRMTPFNSFVVKRHKIEPSSFLLSPTRSNRTASPKGASLSSTHRTHRLHAKETTARTKQLLKGLCQLITPG